MFLPARAFAAPSVSTVIGDGSSGYSDSQVNNPYGLLIGPDRALYFCDLDNQRIRRLDLKTRRTIDVAGNGQRAYAGDGGRATSGSLNMPHEIAYDTVGHLYIAELDNHVIRKIDGRFLRRRRRRVASTTSSAAQHRRRGRRSAADLRCRQSPHPQRESIDRND
jgi:hypothetical protein